MIVETKWNLILLTKKGEQNSVAEDEGQYATTDDSRFMLWESHDVVGIVCGKCGKAIWTFV